MHSTFYLRTIKRIYKYLFKFIIFLYLYLWSILSCLDWSNLAEPIIHDMYTKSGHIYYFNFLNSFLFCLLSQNTIQHYYNITTTTLQSSILNLIRFLLIVITFSHLSPLCCHLCFTITTKLCLIQIISLLLSFLPTICSQPI